MKLTRFQLTCFGILLAIVFSCSNQSEEQTDKSITEVTAKDILGNPAYRAISYEGYREKSREIQPTVAQLKEDVRILHAMGIRLLRTSTTCNLPMPPIYSKQSQKLKEKTLPLKCT